MSCSTVVLDFTADFPSKGLEPYGTLLLDLVSFLLISFNVDATVRTVEPVSANPATFFNPFLVATFFIVLPTAYPALVFTIFPGLAALVEAFTPSAVAFFNPFCATFLAPITVATLTTPNTTGIKKGIIYSPPF